MINPLLTSSLTFMPGSLSSSLSMTADKFKQEEEIHTLKKQVRQKEAEFLKERAILVQQVELLKMQLCESSEREMNLKKINENIMTAFQNHQGQNQSMEIEITEDHPKVMEIIKAVRQEFTQSLQNERERNRESEYRLERDNQQMNFRVLDLNKQLEVIQKQYDYQVKEYQQLFKKNNEEVKHIEDKLRSDYEIMAKKLSGELEAINADIERQVIMRLNERYQSDQDQNEVIIKYQKEQQVFLDEQSNFRKRIESLEKELSSMQDKHRKAEDENGSLRFKIKQLEKKSKEDLDLVKKQKEEVEKRVETLELQQSKKSTSNIQQKKPITTMGGPVKSRNSKNPIFNKENVTANKYQPPQEQVVKDDDDEEKNKLRRQISLLRCQLKKLEIEIKDLKMKSNQEIAQLKDKLNVERKKRMNIYEDKIDKNNQLLQDLLEKDQTIISLNRQISKLQEKLQTICGTGSNNRSGTPNHLLAMSMHESMYHHNFTQSLVDLFPNQQYNTTQSQKKLISPLRSLDLTLLNKDNINNLNSLSFSLLPIQPKKNRNQRQSSLKKKALTTSPQQIKRNRINSVQVSTRGSANNLAASLNMLKGLRTSRDASIAEVNEDLYRDSVESLPELTKEAKDFDRLESQNIRLQFDKPKKVKNYYQSLKNQDEELRSALLAKSNNNQNNEVYYDSLDNESENSDSEEVNKFMYHYQRGDKTSEQAKLRVNSLNIGKESVKKHKAKVRQNPFSEDDDCLVNILEQEDTNIELQPTLQHTRQHLSTENLFKESQNTIETLQSFRNHNMQKQIREMNRQKQASIPIPKPNKHTYQKGAVQKIMRLKDSYSKTNRLEDRKNSLSKPHEHIGDPTMMKSPSSPNVIINGNIQNHSSSSNKNRMGRMDSCPSPLDEDETVLMLGSGEKLRIKEMAIQNLDQYSQQFRQKFKGGDKPPTTKNKTRQNIVDTQRIGLRTRTNSLINSCCSEISFKMKFIGGLPNLETQQQQQSARVPNYQHQRVPSLKLPINTGQIKTFNYTQR